MVHEITNHTFLHEKFRTRMYDAHHYDAHPMGLLTSSVAGLSTFYPDAKDIEDPDVRMEQIVRLIAKMPTMAASAYRHAMGLPYVFPDNALDYPSNFLNMMFQVGNPYEVHPALHKAMEILLILHADHEQNCSTTAARVVGSAHADPCTARLPLPLPPSTALAMAAPTRRCSTCSTTSAASTTFPPSSKASRPARDA